ncbi:MAG TPA: hypothetical protein VMA73_23340 [Streptosporangiaceae bacterium]|nr:hypothetical protein [Streptosporangiaceae bacterium]
MPAEALAALAAAGGTAVIQAAGTDLWVTFRERVAGLFGRGHKRQTEAALEQLDQTAVMLEQAVTDSEDETDVERVRTRLEIAWQTRFTDLLESLDPGERAEAAERLRELVELAQGGVSAATGGMAVGGDVDIHAEGGSVAAGVIHGGVRIGNPPQPGPDQR